MTLKDNAFNVISRVAPFYFSCFWVRVNLVFLKIFVCMVVKARKQFKSYNDRNASAYQNNSSCLHYLLNFCTTAIRIKYPNIIIQISVNLYCLSLTKHLA